MLKCIEEFVILHKEKPNDDCSFVVDMVSNTLYSHVLNGALYEKRESFRKICEKFSIIKARKKIGYCHTVALNLNVFD